MISFKTKFRLLTWWIVSCLLIGDVGLYAYKHSKLKENNAYKQTKTNTEAKELAEFTEKAMTLANVKLSDTKRGLLRDKIVATTMKYLDTVDGRQSYIIMLGIETGFNNSLKSNKGATGIAQLMPKLFTEFAKECDLKVNQDDIFNEDVNLEVSACHYKQLLLDNDDNAYLAALAYNGGQGTADSFRKKKDIPHESALYLDNMVYYQGLANNGR